jgi:hypothetical protein
MSNVVNLRIVRKRAARQKTAQNAANKRLAYGVSKAERNSVKANRELTKQKIDQHKIERGDR